MKKAIRLLSLCVILIVSLFLMTSCFEDDTTAPSTNPTVTSVVVSPYSADVAKGSTQSFSATVYGTNSPAQSVNWTLTGAHTGTTINSSGLLTVASNESSTTLTVRATSTVDTSKYGTATVNVITGSGSATVTTVVVSPATATVVLGGTQQFTVVVNGTNNPPQTVNWTVIGGNLGTTISNIGLLTVSSNESAASLTVRATSTYDSSKSGTSTVTPTAIGAIGPSGGYIFYDKGSYSDGWRYLEAAPLSAEFMAAWGLNGVVVPDTNYGIGYGRTNTANLISHLHTTGETGRAAQMCAELVINGNSGWFLPSNDELYLMYQNLRLRGLGGFDTSGQNYVGWYWSSSAVSATNTNRACAYRFNDGFQNPITYTRTNRPDVDRVRAVRAF